MPKDMLNDEAEQLIKEQFDVEEPEVLEQFARDTTPQTRVSPERTVDPRTESEGFPQEIAEGVFCGCHQSGAGYRRTACATVGLFF